MNYMSDVKQFEAAAEMLERRFGLSRGVPNFALMYRGQEDGLDIKPHLAGDLKKAEVALKKMIACCKENGVEGTDKEIYFKMRHAGLLSHLVHWSQSLKVALWFAIHDRQGALTDRPACVWVLRPTFSDVQGVWVDHDFVKPTMHFADLQTCERSHHQEAMAYYIRFAANNVLRVVPMNEDPLYQGRIVKIQIATDMSLRR